MDHLDNWYVLWVKTGFEKEAADEITVAFKDDEVIYQQLMIETFFRKQGKVKKEINNAFPGYIIIASMICNDEFILRSYECIRRSRFIIKLLRYGDGYQAAMRKEERAAIESLWQGKYCVETSTGFIEGDHIVITDGPFVGIESIIKSISPRKRQAVIEIEFAGCLRCLTIGLEIIAKLP